MPLGAQVSTESAPPLRGYARKEDGCLELGPLRLRIRTAAGRSCWRGGRPPGARASTSAARSALDAGSSAWRGEVARVVVPGEDERERWRERRG
jgi:hypothetical protein